MTSHSQFVQGIYSLEDKTIYQDQLSKVLQPIFREFDGVIKRYVAFNIFFLLLCFAESALLAFFLLSVAPSLMLALLISSIFFTVFSYFTLRTYFQTKKPEQITLIKDEFVEKAKSLIGYKEGSIDHHVALASACCKLANRLHAREYMFYRPPRFISSLVPVMERCSCWWHWEDVQYFKEQLLQESVYEHIKRVKCEPTSLEGHASLANAYVMLSGLYIDPRKMEGYDDDRWIPDEKYGEVSEMKFRGIAERAIEEFKILSEYAPDDPWVHSQLAYSYHDLQMPQEEIKEYEAIQKLVPSDKDNLYKLGVLYFQQGFNAKGLRVFEDLKRSHYFSKADSLIKFYGSYR